jgi:PhnB protein
MFAVHDGPAALEFYERAFGADILWRFMDGDKVGHSSFRIGEAEVMLADEYPGHNHSPRELGGSSVILYLYVPDVDAMAERAIQLGARLLRPIADEPHGDRVAKIEDPFGHVWMLATRQEDVTPEQYVDRVRADTGG